MPALARVTARGDFDGGDVWANVWHVNLSAANSPLSEAEALDIHDQFDTFYNTALNATSAPNMTYLGTIVQDLNADGLTPWEFSSSITPTAGNVMSQICACVVTLRTEGAGGASKRGRIYIPMNDQGALTAQGLIAGATRLSVTGAVAQLATDLQANTLSTGIAVWSRKLQTVTNVTQVACDNYVAVQRKRQFAILKQATISTVTNTT